MLVKDFDYELPEELIAQDPLEKRSNSRLMVLDKNTGEVTHRHFYDIKEYLKPGDCLVINNTKVIPARLLGIKEKTGAHCELLLLKQLEGDNWECLTRPAKSLKVGARVDFGDGKLIAECTEEREEGLRVFRGACRKHPFNRNRHGSKGFCELIGKRNITIPVGNLIRHTQGDMSGDISTHHSYMKVLRCLKLELVEEVFSFEIGDITDCTYHMDYTPLSNSRAQPEMHA